MDVTVVIRAAGERTEKLCQYIVEQQVPSSQVFVIHERPFWKAVQKTFEIGIEQDKSYTLAVDADVLIGSQVVERMIAAADAIKTPFFCYQGNVVDFIFGRAREGGPHLYANKFLSKALDVLNTDSTVHRPESDTYKALAKEGIFTYIDTKIFGVHDYYQSFSDYYRKAYFHAIKNSAETSLPFFLNHWVQNINTLKVYNLLIKGWLDGKRKGEIEVDIEYFKTVEISHYLQSGMVEELTIDPETFDTYILKVEGLIDSCKDQQLFPKRFPKQELSFYRRYKKMVGNKIIAIGRKIVSASSPR